MHRYILLWAPCPSSPPPLSSHKPEKILLVMSLGKNCCLVVLYWSCMEGYSEFPAWMMLVRLLQWWKATATGMGLLCKIIPSPTNCRAVSTFCLTTSLSPNIKHDPKCSVSSCFPVLLLFHLFPHCCFMKKELDSTCFWKPLLHVLSFAISLDGRVFLSYKHLGRFHISCPRVFHSGRWDKTSSAVTGGPRREHTEPAGCWHHSSGNSWGWILVQGIPASSLLKLIQL